MVYNKIGSIYTDMIKPLEKELYREIREHEDIERRKLDDIYPHLRGIHEDNEDFRRLRGIRRLVPRIAELVVKIGLWKDLRLNPHIPPLSLQWGDQYCVTYLFAPYASLIISPSHLRWRANEEGPQHVIEWSSVVKGEMTPAAFVELLKPGQGIKAEGGTHVPCIITHPRTGINFSGTKEEAIDFLLKELIRAKENIAAQEAKKIQDNKIEPGHIFEIEPYNRSKHGDDGQPVFPKSDAMGPETARELAKLLETHPICKSGAASVSVSKDGRSIKLTSTATAQAQADWSSFALRPKPPVKELSPWQKKINERIEAFFQKESQYYER